jgi:hypothetical protein
MTILISNGSIINKTGHKQIVVSPEGEVRPVQSCVRTGLLHTRHTLQAAMPGDHVYTVRWILSDITYTQSIVAANGTLITHDSFTQQPINLPDEISNWLLPDYVYAAAYLPAGLGWDGVSTRADLNKLDRLQRFFYNLEDPIKSVLIEAGRKAPGRAIPTLWKDAQPLPLELVLTPATDTDWEAVVTWTHTGELQVIKSTDTTLCQFSHLVRKAMHIVFHGGYVQWQLFKI